MASPLWVRTTNTGVLGFGSSHGVMEGGTMAAERITPPWTLGRGLGSANALVVPV